MANTSKKGQEKGSNYPSLEEEEQEKTIVSQQDLANSLENDQDKQKKKEPSKASDLSSEEGEKLLQTTRKIEKTPTNWLNGVGALCIGIGAFGVAIMPVGGVFFIALGIHLIKGNTKITTTNQTDFPGKTSLPENTKTIEADSPKSTISQEKSPLEAVLEKPGDVKLADVKDLLKEDSLTEATLPSLENIFKSVPAEEFLDFMIKKTADQIRISPEKMTSMEPKEFFENINPEDFSQTVLGSFSEKANSPEVEQLLKPQIAALRGEIGLKNAEIVNNDSKAVSMESLVTTPAPVVQNIEYEEKPKLNNGQLGNNTKSSIKEEETEKTKGEEKNISSSYIAPSTANIVEAPIAKLGQEELLAKVPNLISNPSSNLNLDPEMPDLREAAKSVANAIKDIGPKKPEIEKYNDISSAKTQFASITPIETPQKIEVLNLSSAKSAGKSIEAKRDPEMPDFINPAKAVAQALEKVTGKLVYTATENRKPPKSPEDKLLVSSKIVSPPNNTPNNTPNNRVTPVQDR